MATSSGTAPPRLRRGRPRAVPQSATAAIYLVWLCLVGYGGIRLYYYLEFDVPFAQPVNAEEWVWRGQYPEAWHSGAVESEISVHDPFFDVLLLGGSVLEKAAANLESELQRYTDQRFRVFNLARPAHTSRDSYLKNTLLAHQRFELIVIYHGINDVRLNCCLEADFRKDYTHGCWYAGFVNKLNRVRRSALPLIVDTGKGTTGHPTEEQLSLGKTLKTPPVFRSNMQNIVRAASETHTAVLLVTFASYIPADYSQDRLQAGQLDYGDGNQFGMAVECWGLPDAVAKTIQAHNDQLRRLAHEFENAFLIDLAQEFPADGHHFVDVCHMTALGKQSFARRIAGGIQQCAAFSLARCPVRRIRGGDNVARAPGRHQDPLLSCLEGIPSVRSGGEIHRPAAPRSDSRR